MTCILGIETSCDDTCASVVLNGSSILSNVVASQHEIHEKYGGVVPELASRRHVEIIDVIIKEALIQSGVAFGEITAVSVTNRPGLVGSLLVGVGAAKAISYARKIPLIAVNHLKAHLYSNFLVFPEMGSGFIGLIVSGGHSSLYRVDHEWSITEEGHTLDDAAGEAFDKIARFLNLGYPGGPIIDRLAKNGDPEKVTLPRPMLDSGDYNFSFSGLKTALIYRTRKEPELLSGDNIADLAAAFQSSIVEVLIEKTIGLCKKTGYEKILVSGGVAANSALRASFTARSGQEGIQLFIPPVSLCMDNAAMVACLGHHEYIAGRFSKLDVDVYSKSDI
ncbi:MAG: tRNA (adenosine(37)-N6)-threonylcarbamoyltransferase complex transferase subunit TsaD [Actinobacteria bacterium]|nr:tRNA (adenosine(37)-N6)-threonylcarbamoyltransferase complex transferase subunit TsaD [Actinomycetota bacterium]